jgi:DNA polymerase-3 subunit beta
VEKSSNKRKETMKIVLLQSNFAKALGQISRIVGSRTTLPVLSNVLISASKGKIKFSATDLEVGITSQSIGKIEEEGEITIPSRLLSDFVLNNRDESIELSTKNSLAVLKSTRFEAQIQGISAEEFPTVPEPPADAIATISRTKMIDALKKVNIAPATDETRPVLAGIYLQFNGKELVLAATDSYRLAEKKVELDSAATDQKLIVPIRTMAEVLRVISADNSEDISISAKENQISFQSGTTYIVSRLIEGSYPNYAQIIPSSTKTTAKVKLPELLSAVKMSSLFAKDSANNNIKISIGKNMATVSSIASESGSSKSEVEAKTTGEALEVAFNARYLLDVLNVMSDDDITIGFNDSSSAGTIKSEKDENYVYIIMPLKLES